MKPETMLLTVEQAAEKGRVPVDTVRCWIRQGRLDVVRQGGRVLIMRGTLEGLLVVACTLCGARFRRVNLRARFCSDACRKKAHRLKEGKTA